MSSCALILYFGLKQPVYLYSQETAKILLKRFFFKTKLVVIDCLGSRVSDVLRTAMPTRHSYSIVWKKFLPYRTNTKHAVRQKLTFNSELPLFGLYWTFGSYIAKGWLDILKKNRQVIIKQITGIHSSKLTRPLARQYTIKIVRVRFVF